MTPTTRTTRMARILSQAGAPPPALLLRCGTLSPRAADARRVQRPPPWGGYGGQLPAVWPIAGLRGGLTVGERDPMLCRHLGICWTPRPMVHLALLIANDRAVGRAGSWGW